MQDKDWLRIDLLKARRKSAGIKAPKKSFYQEYLKTGIFIGIGIFSIVITMMTNISIRTSGYDQSIREMEKIKKEYELTNASINDRQEELDKTYNYNRVIAQAITGLRSGSELSREIANRIPLQINLKKITVKDDDLTIIGESPHPNALTLINIFIMELGNSPLISSNDISLEKATEKVSNISMFERTDNKRMQRRFLEFKIKSKLSQDIYRHDSKFDKQLAGKGLKKRIDLLRQEALIR